LPFEIRTTASSDFVTSAGKKARYLMPTIIVTHDLLTEPDDQTSSQEHSMSARVLEGVIE
jgi:hypothetical protein